MHLVRQIEEYSGKDVVWLTKGRMSGQRDLNPRPRAWEARTLPLSYARSLSLFKGTIQNRRINLYGITLFVKKATPQHIPFGCFDVSSLFLGGKI